MRAKLDRRITSKAFCVFVKMQQTLHSAADNRDLNRINIFFVLLHNKKVEATLSLFGTYQSVGTSILEILKLRSAMPPTGTRSLPVAKWRSFFCSSSGNANTTSQKHLRERRGRNDKYIRCVLRQVFTKILSS